MKATNIYRVITMYALMFGFGGDGDGSTKMGKKFPAQQ